MHRQTSAPTIARAQSREGKRGKAELADMESTKGERRGEGGTVGGRGTERETGRELSPQYASIRLLSFESHGSQRDSSPSLW